MSNITLFKAGSNLAIPDYLRTPDDVTKALAGNTSGKTISIKGGVWRLMSGSNEIAKNEDRAMNFIILAAAPAVSRTYYAGKYEEGKDAAPACWSADGVKPNEEVPAESRQCSNCAQCPQNIAGSGEGNSRACRYSQRLAVAVENDTEGNVYRLQLPAKSIFGRPEGDKMALQAYAKFLAGHSVPITGVVTEARFDTAEAVPVIKFRAVRPLNREEWEFTKGLAAGEDAQRAIEFKMVVKPKDNAPKNPLYAEPAAAVAPAPAPVRAKPAAPAVAPAEESDDVAEPIKRAARKPAAPVVTPTEKGSMVDILDAWGSDDDN